MSKTAPQPKITAIAPWFGSKRSMSPRIVEELGSHESYFEPFCGSMAVLFGKTPSRQETVCDLHGHLTNLAWVLQDDALAPRLYERLTRTLFCESDLEDSKKNLAGRNYAECTADLDRAYWFFIHSWCARNGTSGSARMSFKIAVRWTAGGGSPTIRFRHAVESIPAWHDRLRNVVILNRDAFAVLPSIPDEPGVAIYCDPPYLHSTRSGDGDGGFLHDFREGDNPLLGEVDDHGRLALELSRFHRARVVVSYYDHPSLDRLYRGWTKRLCYQQKNLHVQNRRGAGKAVAPEVLFMNGPSNEGCARGKR
jgi:DNA adenine methylase